jgi:ATP-dependent Clp protease ATP-binding subunit ClpA
MAATILNSPRAVRMSIYVVRAFVQLRELLASNQELAKRLDQLEARIEKKLATHDEAITAMLSAIRELMHSPAPKRRGIGFTADIGSLK